MKLFFVNLSFNFRRSQKIDVIIFIFIDYSFGSQPISCLSVFAKLNFNKGIFIKYKQRDVCNYECSDVEVDLYGSVYGTISDSSTSEPLSGVTVNLSPSGTSITTGSNGTYEFSDLESGSYSVQVSKSGYNSDTKSVTVTPGNKTVADMSLSTANGSLSLSPSSLDFGTSDLSLSFSITNTGNGSLDYSIDNQYDWITLSSKSGTIESGRITSITVSIDRGLITEDKSVNLPISSDAGSTVIPIKVTKAVATAVLYVSPNSVDFGESSIYQTFTVYNTGDAAMTFSVNESLNWLSASYTGSVAAGSSSVVTLTLDRDEVYGQVSEDISITSNGGSATVTVMAYEQIYYGTVSNPNTMLSVEVTDVYMLGTTLYLEYKATYTGTQTTDYFTVNGPISNLSSVSDDEGNVYDYNNVLLSLGGSSYSSTNYGVSVYSTTANSVIKGGVQINNVDTNATKMNISLYTNLRINSSNNYGNIVFSNVPIIR